MVKRLNRTRVSSAWVMGCALLTSTTLVTMSAPIQADSSASPIEKIAHLLEISDLKRVASESPEKLSEMYNAGLDNSSDWDHSDPNQVAILVEMKNELKIRFTEKALYQAIMNSIEDTVSPTQLDEQVAFFESSIGKKIARYSAQADERRKTEEYQVYMSGYTPNSIGEARLAMLGEIVDAAQVHELAIDTLLDMQSSMYLGFSDTAPEEVTTLIYSEGGVYALLEQLSAQRNSMVVSARTNMISHENFNFLELSDDEVSQLRDFMVSSAGKALVHAYAAAERGLAVESFYSIGVVSAQGVTELYYAYAELEEQ